MSPSYRRFLTSLRIASIRLAIVNFSAATAFCHRHRYRLGMDIQAHAQFLFPNPST
ncbi:MAG: hypothetical protein ACK5TN_08825 [Acidobacteriota bacterium]|jgi:hypothetical protein